MSDDERDLAHIERALYENVARGFMVVTGEDDDGNPTFALTEAGKRHVEAMGNGEAE